MRKISLLLCVCFSFLLHAQTDSLATQTTEKPYKVAFYLSLISWLDFTSPSINFGVEHYIKPKFSMYYETGYINNNINPLYNLFYSRTFNGFKTSIEPRYYFHEGRKNHLFITPNLYYKFNASYVEDEEYARYGGQYFQLYSYQRQLHTFSITPKFGMVSIKAGNAVGVEFSAGAGIRVLHVGSNIDFPADATLNNRDWFPSLTPKPFGTYVRPNLMLHLALVFLGNKEKAAAKTSLIKGF